MIDYLIKLAYSRYLDVASKIARRKMRKVRGADAAWFVCLAMFAGGCAHRQQVRAIHAIEARCVAAIEAATTERDVRDLSARCYREIDEASR